MAKNLIGTQKLDGWVLYDKLNNKIMGGTTVFGIIAKVVYRTRKDALKIKEKIEIFHSKYVVARKVKVVI